MADDARRATFNLTAPNLKLEKIINRLKQIFIFYFPPDGGGGNIVNFEIWIFSASED